MPRQPKLTFIGLLSIFLLAFTSIGSFATVYVKADSPGPTFDGSSWNTAYHTIQEDLNDAGIGGEEVRVAGGRYNEKITLASGVILQGGYSGTGTTRDTKIYSTIIDGPITGTADNVVTGANNSTIDGFVITGGYTGVYCDSTSPTVSNCLITGSLVGFYCVGASPTISNNTISDQGTAGIECIDYCSPTISNNIIKACGNGILCICSVYGATNTPVITGNTIVRNRNDRTDPDRPSPLGGVGVSFYSEGTPVICNNIIAFNTAGVQFVHGTPTLANNDIVSNTTDYIGTTAGSTDISIDPQFASVEYGNFHIRNTSPCRDAGDKLAAGMSEYDIDGQSRVKYGAVDIGADETQGEAYPVPRRSNITCDQGPWR